MRHKTSLVQILAKGGVVIPGCGDDAPRSKRRSKRSGRGNLKTLSWFSLDKRKKKRKPGKSNWGWFKRNKALYEGEHARPVRKVKPVVEQVADALQVVPGVLNEDHEARQRMYRGVQSVHSKRTTLAPFLKAPSL